MKDCNLVIYSLQAVEFLDQVTALTTYYLVEKHLEFTWDMSNNLTERSVKRSIGLGTGDHDF